LTIPIVQVDAFTDRAFAGNPAAVCLLAAPRDEGWMQNVAREMNLSETAFLVPRKAGYDLRWFTPEAEVDLCGHATLASAHVLWEEDILDKKATARFHTHSGLLSATRKDGWIEMDFPAELQKPAIAPPALAGALGTTPVYIGKNRFDYLVELDSEEVLRNLHPDFALLKTIPARGVIVTSPSDSKDYDFVSRFFAPALGINEDPVTGSAHCCLGPYWQKRLKKDSFTAYQASARGGIIRVSTQGDRVLLGGQAVTVLRGELLDQR
jgi:PhzF family phenazine biosynthesis protein